MNAAALPAQNGLPPGTRLAEFEVQEVLGAGGFGVVYRAYDHSLHRTVAIKEYMPRGLAGRAGQAVVQGGTADAAVFDAGLRAFMAEARTLARFDHPSLVKVFRVWEGNRTAYMAMPFYEGLTLKAACAQMRQPPPEAWLRRLLWPLLQALELLHRQSIVHRDISPDNIFLQDRGPPVLLDLGAARGVAGPGDPQDAAVLKIPYAPVEQYADAAGMRQGPWSDVYALAAVVYGCLSQALPLPATARARRDAMPSPGAVAEALRETRGLVYSQAFVDALTQALAVDPARRPQDLAAFSERLQLQPAPGMDRFDWRAELGTDWQPSRRPQGPAGQHAPTLWLAQVRGPAVPAASRPGAPSGRPVAAVPVPSSAPVLLPLPPPRPLSSSARTAPPWWLPAGAAVLILGLLAAFGMVAAPRGAPPVAAVAPLAASVALPAPRPAVAGPGLESLARAAPVAMPDALPALPQAVVRPVPIATARPAHDAVRHAPAPRALSAQQICPDSNFLTRPMCLFRACQAHPYAAMPVCVELLQRLRENERRHGP